MSTLRPPAPSEALFEHHHADPWGKSFVDLPSLNARVSDAIASAIQSVRLTAREESGELRSKSILVLGPAGAGKTHLFARLRRRLGPRAVFVHLRPLVGTEMTPRYVLAQIFQQLVYEPAGLRQIDALVGASLAHLEGEPPDLPRAFLDHMREMDEDKRQGRIDAAVERVLERHPEADDTYLARLIETPFLAGVVKQRAALAWLGGRELEESQARRLGVSGGLSEDRMLQGLKTLGVFAAPGTPIVLVFDQLENLVEEGGSGARVRAFGNLVAELFDTMRGLVLVQMALDTEWDRGIFPLLSEAQKTRLSVQKELLSLPTPDEKRELLKRWAAELPFHPEPFPWPFGEKRVNRWCETLGLTPRMLQIECKHALAEGTLGSDDALAPRDTMVDQGEIASEIETRAAEDALTNAWASHLTHARAALDEAARDRRSADTARLAGGIASALRFLRGAKTVKVDARQPVQLVVKTGDAEHAVCILHQNHPRSVAASLDRAKEAAAKARLVVVRERALDFPPTWKQVHTRQLDLVKGGAVWHTLDRDDAANLLALESFLAAARSRDLEDERGQALDESEVLAWIIERLSVPSWSVVRAIGGDPIDGEEDGPGYIVEELPSSPNVDVYVPGRPSIPPEKVEDGTGGALSAILTQLRIASLDRLVREVARVKPKASRAEVVGALERMGGRVRWFGRSILGIADGNAEGR